VSASNLRFGDGVTREIGQDLFNMGAKKVAVFTDATVAKLEPMKVVSPRSDEAGGRGPQPYDLGCTSSR
jgi:hydroxyacid-oxoacid transhydrogenase